MSNFIQIKKDNIDTEHICCAFSDKKCSASYQLKKDWLKKEFDNGYIFYRLNERAKVFVEYGPAENAWLPVKADNCLNINCFWVSGKYKRTGLGKQLLQKVEDDALKQGRTGIITVTGRKKFHFMSDGKWFQKQGFSVVDETETGFILLAKNLTDSPVKAEFRSSAKDGTCEQTPGLTVYYSNRCPYAEFHVRNSLVETAQKRNIPLNIIKLESFEAAQNSPSPATIFSLFYNGRFLTTDLSVCLDSRFDKFWASVNLD
jgi:N-acetylglutamate synthase-like GNAT family acetyltransferase